MELLGLEANLGYRIQLLSQYLEFWNYTSRVFTSEHFIIQNQFQH